MIGLLAAILCVLQNLALSVLAVLIMAANAVISSLAGLIALLLALMPTMPDTPTLPDSFSTILGWIAWFYPVSATLDFLAFAITALLVWWGVSLALRWARAIE